MRKFQFYSVGLAAVIAVSALTGCEEEDIMLIVPRVAINIESDDMADTRAASTTNNTNFYLGYAASDNTGNRVSSKSIVGVWADNGAGTYTAKQYKVSSKGELTIAPLAASDNIYFTPGKTECNMYAWYPYTANSTTHVVNSDQTSDFNYALSDLLIAQTVTHTRSKSGNTWSVTASPALDLKHALSKIIITVNLGSGITQINSVKLINVKRQVPISVTAVTNTNKKSVAVGTAVSVDPANVSMNTAGFTSSTTLAAVIPPQAINADFIVVNATTSTGRGDVTYSVNTTFAGNNTYSVTLTPSAMQVGLTVSISNWGANNNLTVTGDGKI